MKTSKIIVVSALIVAVLAVNFSLVQAHEGHHNEPEVRITQMKTIVKLLEYIKEFLETHGQTLADRGVMMPQVYVTIPASDSVVIQEPVITIETGHGSPHFHYTRSDGTTVESPVDSALDDRGGLMNELIVLTHLSEERIAEITVGLPE